MRRALVWSRRLLLALLLLVVLLVSLIAFLVNSATSTRWVFDMAERWLPALDVGAVTGSLAGPLDISALTFQPENASRVEIERIELEWSPSRLLRGELAVKRLAINGVDLEPAQAAADAPAPAETSPGFSLPERIDLPLAVEIGELSVTDVQVKGQPQPLVLSLNLSAAAKNSVAELRSLSFESPQLDLDLSGQLALEKDFRLQLSSNSLLRLPERPEIAFKGQITGPLERLTLEQEASGPLSAKLEATLSGIDSPSPHWEAALNLSDVDLDALAPEMKAAGLSDLSAKLIASGSFESAELALDAGITHVDAGPLQLALTATADKQRAEVTQLSIAQTGGEARIELAGQLSPLRADGDLSLNLNWQNLGYPLDGEAQTVSPEGSLVITGQLDAYVADLDIQLQAPALEPIRVTGQTKGNLQGLSSLNLHSEGPQGEADISGSALWQPQPGWNLTVESDQINPGYFAKDWPGQISTRIRTRGVIAEQPRITASIDKLSGTLREQELSGGGNLALEKGVWQIGSLALSWGDAEVRAEGRIGDQLDLSFLVDLPALQQVIPGAAGRVNAKGRLSGVPAQPAVEADIEVAEFSWQSYRVASADARVVLDTQWQTPANIRLTASDLSLAGQALDRVRLIAEGTEQSMTASLSLNQGENQLDTKLRGKLALTETDWRFDGQLFALDLAQEQIGRWGLDQPVDLNLSADDYRLGQLCLAAQGQSGRVCADGRFSAGKAKAGFSLAKLPLKLVQAYLPAGADISGFLEGEGTFSSVGERLSYSVGLQLPQAALSAPDSDLSLTLDNARLSIQGDEQQAKAQLDMPLKELSGRLNARIDVQKPLTEARLNGQLALELPDLKALNVLSSDLVIQAGQAQADIRLGGKAAAPTVKGVFTVSEGDIELPGAGIRLQELTLDLRDADVPDKLLLNGSVRSGEGRLALQGELWPLQSRIEATLSGDRFQAVDTEALSVLISPDMTVNASPEKLAVGGVLAIPDALIKPPKSSANAASRSQDLVVIEEGQDQGQALGPALDLDLRVELGDRVRVDAFGFDGRLKGALRVQQQGRQGVIRGTGRVGVVSGEYTLYGQRLNITRGDVLFSGGPVTNPGLDLRVAREVDAVSVGAVVSGTLRSPDLQLTSTPAMPDSQILSYLVLGRAPETASAGEQQLMMRMALSLAGSKKVTERLQETLNVDEIGFTSGDDADPTSFYIGKNLSPDLYIKYGVGLGETVNTFLVRYRLTTRWLLESKTSSEASGGDLIYSFER